MFRVVASLTPLLLARFHELPGVNVSMAPRTGRRRGFESGFGELAARLFWFVTFFALHFRVSTDQREGSFGMIEARQVRPRLHVVARFASFCGAVLSSLGHLLIEFAAMRILVASRAIEVSEMIRHGFCILSLTAGLVTFSARYGQMSPGKRIVALLMLRNGVGRWTKSSNGVALFAAIFVGRRCELPLMSIAMAVRAFRVSNLVAGRCTGRHVAFAACNARVLAFQRVRALGVLFDSEERRFPTFVVVARYALALVFSPGELAADGDRACGSPRTSQTPRAS